ncbi:hypothetical protein [Cerasicoccus fimbriatus]|uniref:hypothetical protein n=1 Tax=Cerasicoccus fimbriatus TaxID=3014554 RepID=UPI0022B4DCCE|nr:hypothetical protein [Cerasicoccus sp. TK19100]
MYSYIFIDPEVVTDASQTGEAGLGQLINFLREHRYDCIFSETDSWRLGEELKEKIQAIEFQHERKLLIELAVAIYSNGPFVFIEGDDGISSLLELAKSKAETAEIDFILTPSDSIIQTECKWEACNLQLVYATRFEEVRQKYRPCVIKKPGHDNAHGIWNTYFRKLIKHTDSVQIVDYSIGKYFGENHKFNLKKWIHWLNDNFSDPTVARLKIHTLDNQQLRVEAFINQLRADVGYSIELKYYPGGDDFPHERFLNAEARWLQIGRGIDLFDQNEDCRDIMFSIARRPANII